MTTVSTQLFGIYNIHYWYKMSEQRI